VTNHAFNSRITALRRSDQRWFPVRSAGGIVAGGDSAGADSVAISLFTFKRPSLCFQTDEAYPPALTRNTQGRPGSAQMSAIARGSHQGQARCRRGAGQDRRRLNYENQASDKASACCNTKSTARASWSGGYLYFRKMRLTINRSFAGLFHEQTNPLRRSSANSLPIPRRSSSIFHRRARGQRLRLFPARRKKPILLCLS
jgi:hypothetical protein